jgi:alkyl hydroperoxide reductase subunit AhpC
MREMPNVKAAYEKYKSRGLEIVGISLDRDKAAWEGAVKRVGITWPQATDYNAQGSKVANLYGVQYIPYIVVFDKNGKMVAKNLHGEALLKKLEELMPAK